MPGRSIAGKPLAAFLISIFPVPHLVASALDSLFSFPARARAREVGWRLLAGALVVLFAAPLCRAQLTNVMDDQSTPIPGAGHDYIHLLTETVNPANGSLSVRIQIPVPKSRGITLPFSITYDSNGVTFPTGTPNGYMEWGTGNANYEGVESGGWAYNVPYTSAHN